MNGLLRTSILMMGLAAASLVPVAGSAQQIELGECRLSLFFANGAAGLTQQQRSAIAEFVAGSGPSVVSVVGYASTQGSSAANLRLSRTRASNVATVVEATGAQAAAQGQGEAGPGPASRRVDVVRDGCAVARLGPGIAGPVAAGAAALLLLLTDDSSSINTTGTTR